MIKNEVSVLSTRNITIYFIYLIIKSSEIQILIKFVRNFD